MQPQEVLRVDAVSKKFCRSLRRGMVYGLGDLGRDFVGLRVRTDHLREAEFWALREVGFSIASGEAVGLIGPNGSGKSTLLRLIAGIFPPDVGEVSVRGRVSALIAVGAGFHPHFSGRENIFLMGTVLGLSRTELQTRFDEIVAFAELEHFIDSPVATYSSGMRVRLGFAVATAVDPEFILLDEILAVGDARFRAKCLRRLAKIRQRAAVLFVSHNMAQVTMFCERAIVLDQGRVTFDGPAEGAIEHYERAHLADASAETFVEVNAPIEEAKLSWSHGAIGTGDALTVSLALKAAEAASDLSLRVVFHDVSGNAVGEWGSSVERLSIDLAPGQQTFTVKLDALQLSAGIYFATVVLADRAGLGALLRARRNHTLNVAGATSGAARYQIEGSLVRS